MKVLIWGEAGSPVLTIAERLARWIFPGEVGILCTRSDSATLGENDYVIALCAREQAPDFAASESRKFYWPISVRETNAIEAANSLEDKLEDRLSMFARLYLRRDRRVPTDPRKLILEMN